MVIFHSYVSLPEGKNHGDQTLDVPKKSHRDHQTQRSPPGCWGRIHAESWGMLVFTTWQSQFLVGGDWNIHGNNMVYSTSVYDYINIYLVGGDWNHGIWNDFPYIGNNSPIWRTPCFFRGVGWNHQPDFNWGEYWLSSYTSLCRDPSKIGYGFFDQSLDLP